MKVSDELLQLVMHSGTLDSLTLASRLLRIHGSLHYQVSGKHYLSYLFWKSTLSELYILFAFMALCIIKSPENAPRTMLISAKLRKALQTVR